LSWFQNRLFCHQLLRFLGLKPYETAFFKVTVPKSDILELPQGIDIFNDGEAVSKLSRFDVPTPDNGKFMNFYKLGICLGGYGHKRIPEKKLELVPKSVILPPALAVSQAKTLRNRIFQGCCSKN
jgi:hypothetical protein